MKHDKKLTLNHIRLLKIAMLAITLLSNPNIFAELRIAEIFSDNMVLQRDKEVPVWGWTTPGESVKVIFNGQTVSGKSDANGKWQIKLLPMKANATNQSMTIETSGGESKSFDNVLVGEVWLAAGQSNMVAGGPDKPTGIYPFYQSPDTAAAPMRIRSFGFGTDRTPVEDFPAVYRDNENNEWKDLQIGDSANIPQYFTRILRDALNVPIGMIRVAFSGTNQGAWMSKESMEAFKNKDGSNFYLQMQNLRDAKLAEKPKKTKDGQTISTYDEFWEYQKKWIADPKGKGRYPGGGLREMDFVNWPTILYNTRIYPLAPYAIRGVIWHQGEGGPAQDYDKHLIAMFKQWRTIFGQDFYCIWGTLSRDSRNTPPMQPARKSFYRSKTNTRIRRAKKLADEKMDFVEFYDLGNSNTHWLQKAESGRRMGLTALTLAYNQDHIYTGPRAENIKAENGTVYIKFNHIGKRLIYEPNINGISGVILISADQKARWGNVEVINNDTIKVSHPEIKQVANVSYAIHPNPWETLFNSAGLPASPFSKDFKTPGTYREPKTTDSLIKIIDKGKGTLNLGHVRRDGYSFDLYSKKPTEVKVQAYIPAEWTDFVVQHQGTPVQFETTEVDGQKYITFSAKSDRTPYAVSTKAGAEKFKSIHRF